MAKMNWDRVAGWDAVRGGMSEGELADAADERWFQREAERERLRSERTQQRSSGSKPAPNATRSSPVPSGSKGQQKRARSARLAGKLGVTVKELAAARLAINNAAASLSTRNAAERRQQTAAELGIGAVQLKELNRALSGDDPGPGSSVAKLIRRLAGGGTRPSARVVSTRPGGVSAATVGRRETTAKKPKARSGKQKGGSPRKGPGGKMSVFVTTWGNVVHLYCDCRNTRGFRRVSEGDPDVYRVPPSDPSCEGRRVCGTCARSDSGKAERLRSVLLNHHGKPFDEREWERRSWDRPRPTGEPFIRGRS